MSTNQTIKYTLQNHSPQIQSKRESQLNDQFSSGKKAFDKLEIELLVKQTKQNYDKDVNYV